MWPWSELRRLRQQVVWYASREDYFIRQVELHRTIALQAMRDRSACNKGIRRLKQRLERYEKGQEKAHEK